MFLINVTRKKAGLARTKVLRLQVQLPPPVAFVGRHAGADAGEIENINVTTARKACPRLSISWPAHSAVRLPHARRRSPLCPAVAAILAALHLSRRPRAKRPVATAACPARAGNAAPSIMPSIAIPWRWWH